LCSLTSFQSAPVLQASRSKDPYLALATRLAIDLYLTHSLSRFSLTSAWTLPGLLLADVAPSIWRDTGLKNVYKAFRKELRAIRKVIPRWKIENDLRFRRKFSARLVLPSSTFLLFRVPALHLPLHQCHYQHTKDAHHRGHM